MLYICCLALFFPPSSFVPFFLFGSSVFPLKKESPFSCLLLLAGWLLWALLLGQNQTFKLKSIVDAVVKSPLSDVPLALPNTNRLHKKLMFNTVSLSSHRRAWARNKRDTIWLFQFHKNTKNKKKYWSSFVICLHKCLPNVPIIYTISDKNPCDL
jgi:hypothetical protein